jgi:tagaturonate reductase
MLTHPGDPPILQFGTGRFLLAHVDLFVSQALASGQALGRIAVVRTTRSAESAERVAALVTGGGYPVRVRGLQHGVPVDQTLRGEAIAEALDAASQWPRVRALVLSAQVIVSNTGDAGYRLDPQDDVRLLDPPERVPSSFPAKLLGLLHARWQLRPEAPLSIYPCELVARNGEVLRGVVSQLARDCGAAQAFIEWLSQHCRWANSLVDRIVSEAIAPVGAVAEPYALWAIERQPGLVLPCTHEAMVLTDDLARHERLKLLLLNLGHSFLAERWLQAGRPDGMTVLQAMRDEAWRAELEALWADEVLPVFDALGEREPALGYLDALRDRLLNPFLAHRLADIAQNHGQKKQRRFAPAVALAREHGLPIAQPRLHAALQSTTLA